MRTAVALTGCVLLLLLLLLLLRVAFVVVDVARPHLRVPDAGGGGPFRPRARPARPRRRLLPPPRTPCLQIHVLPLDQGAGVGSKLGLPQGGGGAYRVTPPPGTTPPQGDREV